MLATMTAQNPRPSDRQAIVRQKYILSTSLVEIYRTEPSQNRIIPTVTIILIWVIRGFSVFQSSLFPKNCDAWPTAVLKSAIEIINETM
jgi:hypothetical protein